MPGYLLLCNFTEQGIKRIDELPKRRVAVKELAREFGVEIKSVRMALGAYALIVDAETERDEAMAAFALTVAARGNLHATAMRVFSEAETDKIIAGEA